MEKTFKSIVEQIQILKSRNISIEDYNKTYGLLNNNNYYYLINGYKNLFLNNESNTENYINGTKIEEIHSLYLFDKKQE
ncbi:MAG: hypothetical protein HFJ42_00830 [Clostridia bacterium]|nr:hypothetical protein [Clostridia bacterium]